MMNVFFLAGLVVLVIYLWIEHFNNYPKSDT